MTAAAQTIDAQRKALLAAVATQGSAGRAAYEAQIKETDAARQEAVKAATQRAGVVSAPEEAHTALAQSAASIADRYRADADAGVAAYDREHARMTQANDDYMGQVKGAIPIAEAYARAVAAEKEAEEAGTPLDALVDRLGGQTLAKTQLGALAQQRAAAIRRTPMNQRTDSAVGAGWRGAKATRAMGLPVDENEATLGELATETGVTPAILKAFLGDQAPGFKKAPTADERKVQNRAKIIQTKGYKSRAQTITQAIAEERSKKASEGRKDLSVIKAELRAELLASKWAKEHPYIAAELIRDYL